MANSDNVHVLSAKFGRRIAIRRLTEPYPHLLVKATQDATVKMPDERHRSLLSNERRRAAVLIAAELMASFFGHRAKLEQVASPLDEFAIKTQRRVQEYREKLFGGHMPENMQIGAGVVTQRMLLEFERPWVQAIFGAFIMEMRQPDVDETRFWRDIFLGISDADDTDTLGQAARLVFLDHSLEFDLALRKTIQVQANAEGVPTLQ